MKLRSALVSALFLLAACATDKYPYPPQFVGPDSFSETTLPAPPAKGSKEFNKEIEFIIKEQATLSDAEKAMIMKEDHIAPQMMVLPVLGDEYTSDKYPALYTLLKHAASDAWRIGDVQQQVWKSPRPWYTDERVQLLVNRIVSPGYPSGHTTTNTVWAYTLSEIFPAKRAAFFARANEIATHRMHGGAHFPHDLDGGRNLAKQVFGKMQDSLVFQRELKAAKAEVAAQKPCGKIAC